MFGVKKYFFWHAYVVQSGIPDYTGTLREAFMCFSETSVSRHVIAHEWLHSEALWD